MYTSTGIFYTVHTNYMSGQHSYELSNLSVALICLGIYLGWRTWSSRKGAAK